MGHPPIASHRLDAVQRMAARGTGTREIARQLGVHRATVARYRALAGCAMQPSRASVAEEWRAATKDDAELIEKVKTMPPGLTLNALRMTLHVSRERVARVLVAAGLPVPRKDPRGRKPGKGLVMACERSGGDMATLVPSGDPIALEVITRPLLLVGDSAGVSW